MMLWDNLFLYCAGVSILSHLPKVPSDWFKKEPVSSYAGEDRQEFWAEIESLGENLRGEGFTS